MDDDAVKRAMERIASAASGHPGPAEVDAVLERARKQVEALAQAATELEATLPERVGEAVREGVRAQAQPLSRQVAEMRGLMNRLLRKLEHVEGDLLAERNARVDDLALLVDLITSGWRGVDERLGRIDLRTAAVDTRVAGTDERLTRIDEAVLRLDERFDRLEKALSDKSGAVVYRIEERRSS